MVWGALLAALFLDVGVAVADPLGTAQEQPFTPPGDLAGVLRTVPGQTPDPAPVQRNPEPPLAPAPRAECGPGSRPLDGMQGRVPESAVDSPEAAQGWTCNTTLVGRHRTPGGFRVWRYVDPQGNECAYYDTSLFTPLNVVRLGAGPSTGVAVLDMSNPTRPVETARLQSIPMLSPHESLNLNAERGLLAANTGNGLTVPALMSIYDIRTDCRRPVHKATTLAARFGHESGFSPDGRTYWISGGVGIAAVDVTDPARPRTLWQGNVTAHGLNVSADGNRLYDADPINGHLAIFDVSEIQERRPDPEVREVSRLTWSNYTIPQNTNPMTIKGKPYLLEFDEFAFRFNDLPPPNTVGGARIIDISDERQPRVVSNLRLEVNQREQHRLAEGDPSPFGSPMFSYTAHYCAIPREVDPEIAACTFVNSGLRIFNIEDPERPREVGYFIAPPKEGSAAEFSPGNLAMSQPAFVPERREVWYSDANSGLYVLRLSERAWRGDRRPCRSRRRFHARVRLPRGARVRSVRATLGGRRVSTRRRGSFIRVPVDLRGRGRGRVRLVVRVRLRNGRAITDRRAYHPCMPRR